MCLLRSECVLTLSTKMSVWATSFSLASGAIKLDANHFRMFMWCYLCHCPRYSTTTSTTPENTRREAGVKSLPILSALKSWFRRVFYSVFALYVWAALQCTVSPAYPSTVCQWSLCSFWTFDPVLFFSGGATGYVVFDHSFFAAFFILSTISHRAMKANRKRGQRDRMCLWSNIFLLASA